MTVMVTYDAALCATPMAVTCHVLEAELAPVVGGKLDGGAAAHLGISEDMDPLYRAAGQEIHVTYSAALTAGEASAALAVVAAHASTVKLPAQTLMTSADVTGDVPPGSRCLINTAGGPSERTLPKVSEAIDVTIMHCSGASALVVRPHADEQGSVTIDGGASMTMGDGDSAVLGVDQDGNWVNLGPKAPP